MKQLMLVFVMLWSGVLLAQQNFTAGIPTKYMNDPAVDLMYKGNLLLPDEVNKLREDSHGRFDISTLNPVENSDLWKNIMPGKLPEDKNPLEDMDEVVYHSPVITPSGLFRFNVQNKSGDGKIYTVMVGKTVHSFLLAKSLLRKIGYQIPDIKYLPRLTLKFKNSIHKESFINYFKNVVMLAPEYWVVEELEDNKIIMQDLLVMDSNHPIYNLAVGVTQDMIQGRRLLSSLAVPLSIVNLVESVNLLRWNVGTINNNQVALYHDNLDDFQCTWDDARWITRRIEKLTRDDWKEIVASSHTPKPVQMILTEKLISRRNSAMKLFKIDHEEIKVDADISNGVELVHGKLTQQQWPGYGARFAYGDPDSPLADSEMKSFLKSKLIGLGLDVLVSQLNQNIPYLSTDIQTKNEEEFKKILQDAVTKSQETQTPVSIPLKTWAYPTYRGQIIMSRNIVTGTYLGTDNLVQLVDTIGISLSGGMFVGAAGLPTPFKAAASAEASIVRTYAHLRPVTSIQKALKYPYHNIMIPLVKREYGKQLQKAADLALDPNATDDSRQKAIEEAMKPFKDNMEVGESLLVTDSIVTGAGLKVMAGQGDIVKGTLSLLPGFQVVSRFHVHRRTENEFHIYRDLGSEGTFGVSFDLDSYIPVLKATFKAGKGAGRVKFFKLSLDPKNEKVIDNMSLLRRAIVSSSTRDLEEKEETKPFIVHTDYKEKTPNVGLFFFQWNWDDASSNIDIENPHGDHRYFKRFYHGSSRGKNYQAYVNATVSHWVELLFNKKAGLSDSTGSNPGYSYKGSARTKFLTLDQEVNGSGKRLEPFVRLSRIFNGWSIKRKDAEKLLEELRTRYRYDFFNAPVLNDTRRIFLYNISLNVLFYKAGIDNLISLTDDQIKEIFRKNRNQTDLTVNPREMNDEDSGGNKMVRFMTRFRKYEKEGKEDKASKYLLKAFSHSENNLTLEGLTQLMGGKENLYVYSKIDGFREGDEDGDKNLVSNSYGEYGSQDILGPLVELQKDTNMLEGEFFLYWMMSRLI
ncbi:MAG: hypothetical protein ACJ76H_14870 [Bacteriovoracaceae bacterium]